MAQLEMAMKDIAHKITLDVRIKGITVWRWRVKLGLWMIQFAAWVMWLNIEIVDHTAAPENVQVAYDAGLLRGTRDDKTLCSPAPYPPYDIGTPEADAWITGYRDA